MMTIIFRYCNYYHGIPGVAASARVQISLMFITESAPLAKLTPGGAALVTLVIVTNSQL